LHWWLIQLCQLIGVSQSKDHLNPIILDLKTEGSRWISVLIQNES